MTDQTPPGPAPQSPLQRAKQIFLAVSDLPQPRRDEEIARLCAGDARLRGMVEGLLEGDQSPLPFESLADEIVAARDEMAARQASDGDAPDESQLGSRIGRYRVVERIGEGGFGVVYRAEQDEPVRRQVALKIIKLGMDTRRVVARFEQERQALALMDHPNIAKVHDAGATPTGRPFFVMELCSGEAITDYCDRNRLSVRDRLGLLVQVCHAVQHAHQKGLIHRDLKPSNILVATVDGKPLAKVIDFGIAKATQANLTEKTVFTEHRQLIGTPEYMSPEQADGSLDIDTRSDVYSLGVLLYELLTGSTPFSGRDLRSAAFAEIQRIIREDEPPRPSTRLSQSSGTLAGVAANRATEPSRLGTLIRGELDWVVMRALDKARNRRYASPADLAGDIERFLRDEPVQARPATPLYRFEKFARRNRVLVGAGAAVALSMVVGLVATTSMYLRAERSLVREAAERARAQTKSETTQAINDFLIQDLLAAPNPWEGGGRKVTVAEVLDKAASRVGSRFSGKPEVEAAIRTTLGESFRSLGLFDAAKPQYERALELRSSAKDGDEAVFAEVLRMSASNTQSMGLFKEAEPICRDALARHTRLFGADSPQVAQTLDCLGDIQIGQSLYAEAEKTLREALGIREAIAARGKAQPSDDIALARTTSTLASSLHYQGKFEEGETLKLKAVEIFKGASPSAGGGERGPYAAQALSDLGSLYFEVKRYDESERYFRMSLPILVELLGPEHSAVLVNQRSLANTLSFQGKGGEAEAMLKDVIGVSERTLGATHTETLGSVNSLATLMLRGKRYPEAEPLLRSLYDRSVKEYGPKHAETLKYSSNFAWCEKYLGKNDDADKHFRIAVEGFEETLGPTHPYAISSKDGLAQFLSGVGRFAEAAKYDKMVIDGRAAAGEPEDLNTARILSRVGANLIRAGDFVAAKEPLEHSLVLCRKGFPPGDWRTGTSEWRLGDCLSNLGQRDEAEALLLAGIRKIREDKSTPPGSLGPALEQLAAHYERAGETDKAARTRAELILLQTPSK